MNKYMIKNYIINEPSVVCEEMGNEIVVINLETGCYYNLNQAATVIWHLISKKISYQRILDHIVRNNKTKEETVSKDLKDLFHIFIKENLVVENNNTTKNNGNKDNLLDNRKKSKYQRPSIKKYSDMKEMLELDPIHEVTNLGWPNKKV